MKRHRSKRRAKTIHVWTHDQARQAQAYISSILRSLRERALEIQAHGRSLTLLDRRPGRPTRADLIARQDALTARDVAEAGFREVIRELQELDLYALDPVGGQALIPIIQDQQLAWLVFDLFDADPLQHWRFHKDPLEARRPVKELRAEQDSVVV